jgi:hypothetical protein
VSLFKIVKYSSLIYVLGRHRSKLFRSAAVLLFAFITSLLYEDIRHYLELQHPGTLLYALTAKIIVVYGSLVFVLWQFRPNAAEKSPVGAENPAEAENPTQSPADRLDALADVDTHDRLRSRYDRILNDGSRATKSKGKDSGEPAP